MVNSGRHSRLEYAVSIYEPRCWKEALAIVYSCYDKFQSVVVSMCEPGYGRGTLVKEYALGGKRNPGYCAG